jgi:hypothetical protein
MGPLTVPMVRSEEPELQVVKSYGVRPGEREREHTTSTHTVCQHVYTPPANSVYRRWTLLRTARGAVTPVDADRRDWSTHETLMHVRINDWQMTAQTSITRSPQPAWLREEAEHFKVSHR